MERWKNKVNKLGNKTLPGVEEVFSYVEGGTCLLYTSDAADE